MLSIIYNNKDSKQDYNLYLENVPSFPSINAKYENINIPGSENGSLNIFDGFEDMNIPLNFVFKAKEDFMYKKARIISWLLSKESRELIYSLDKTVCYLVKKVNISEFKTTSKIIRSFMATFTLDPFTYLVDGLDILEITKFTQLDNDRATYNSKPYLKIYGSGDIAININRQSLVLKGVVDNIEVDSFKKNCYKTVNDMIVNQNDKMYSSFPYLEVGENSISWTGTVTKIEIIPRWCCL